MQRLPAFVILGAQKAGTTALRRALAQHPQIFLPDFPEPAFFAFEGGAPAFDGPQLPNSRFGLIPSVEEYGALYAGATDSQVAGDVSSHYSYCWPERTAACMAHYIPDARLIAILRQPADRAYSAFNMMRQKGLEPLADFSAALAAEATPKRANWTPDFSYFRNGLYYTKLAPYFRLFGPQQIRIFLYEEWMEQPAWMIGEICRFLGLAEPSPLDLSQRHRTSLRPRSTTAVRMVRHGRRWLAPLRGRMPGWLRSQLHALLWTRPAPLPPALRRTLTAGYVDDIRLLEKLIERNLRAWLTTDVQGSDPVQNSSAGDAHGSA